MRLSVPPRLVLKKSHSISTSLYRSTPRLHNHTHTHTHIDTHTAVIVGWGDQTSCQVVTLSEWFWFCSGPQCFCPPPFRSRSLIYGALWLWLDAFIQLLKVTAVVKGCLKRSIMLEFYYPQPRSICHFWVETIGFEVMNIFGPILIWLLCMGIPPLACKEQQLFIVFIRSGLYGVLSCEVVDVARKDVYQLCLRVM